MGYYILEPKYDEILKDNIPCMFVYENCIHSRSKEHLIFWVTNILNDKIKSMKDDIGENKTRLYEYERMASNLNAQAGDDTNKRDTNRNLLRRKANGKTSS